MAEGHWEHCTVSEHDVPYSEAVEDPGCTKILTAGQASAWARRRPDGTIEVGVDPAGPMTPPIAAQIGLALVQLAALAGVTIPAIAGSGLVL